MSYHVDYPEMKDALLKIGKYSWGLFYRPSQVTLCRISEVNAQMITESQEIRFFNASEELHVFLGLEHKAIHIVEDDADNTQTVAYALNGQFARSTGKSKLVVRQYLEEDEDGQVCIALTRLVDVI